MFGSVGMPWWIWLAPLLFLPVFYLFSATNWAIAELLLVSLKCAVLPAMVMAGVSWWLFRNRHNVVHKARTTILIALSYGLLVAVNVYVMLGPSMTEWLPSPNVIDQVIFAVLVIVFSANLGLASVFLLGFLYYRQRSV